MKTSHDSSDVDASEDADLSSLTAEQQLEILANSLEVFCHRLQQRGLDAQIITETLLMAFQSRMADDGDREHYEELLVQAIEEPWEDCWIH